MKEIIKNIIVITLLLAVFVCANFTRYIAPNPIGYITHVAEKGDTLWILARKSDGYGNIDTRAIINDMQKKSDIDDCLMVGDIVYIPVYDRNGGN